MLNAENLHSDRTVHLHFFNGKSLVNAIFEIHSSMKCYDQKGICLAKK